MSAVLAANERDLRAAAECVLALDKRDPVTSSAQSQCRCHASEATADNDDRTAWPRRRGCRTRC